MYKSYKVALGAVLPILAVLGCKGDYLSGPKLTTDPNAQTEVRTPDQYFVAIQANEFFQQESGLARTVAIWHQQMAGVDRQYASLDVYNYSEDDYSGFFDGFYNGGGLIDIRKLQVKVSDQKDRRYLGIAKIVEAFDIGTAADIWGDIPYSEAVNPAIATPKLDKQLAVYGAIETLLDGAITDLAAGVGAGPGKADLVYAGSAAKWTALAHTLKARYYMHQAEVDPANYAKALTEAQLGISSPANDYTSYHSATPTEWNLWYQFQQDRDSYMRSGAFLVNLLKSRNDPRLPAYFADGASSVGSLPGESLGSATNLAPERGGPDFSKTRPGNPAFRQPLFTYAENQLIIAEASYQTGDQVGALTALNNERASQSLATPLVGLVGPALLTEIMTEKYIALFQNIEVWSDYRRTCQPKLTPAPGKTAIPSRLLYPFSERNTNPNIPAPSAQPQRNQNDPNACT